MNNLKILKKSGNVENYDYNKIRKAIGQAGDRIKRKFSSEEDAKLKTIIENALSKYKEVVTIKTVHDEVENGLREVDYEVFKEYSNYRNYKERFNKSFNSILKTSQNIIYTGDKENANKDSCIISTKKELVAGLVGKEFYLNYELPKHLADAHNDLSIYIHDAGDRFYNSINCCLFDVGNVLKGGFNLNGKFIKEPKSIEKALDLLADIILVASSQQYGGFTIATIDEVFAPYVELSYKELIATGFTDREATQLLEEVIFEKIKSIQYKIECVNNANGQTAFLTWTFGLGTDKFARMISNGILAVREQFFAIFPKLIYLHVNEYSGEGMINEDLYKRAIRVTMNQMYPDYLSGNAGVQREVFDRTGTMISMMGCRAQLSPYWDENGKERYIGRFNLGL